MAKKPTIKQTFSAKGRKSRLDAMEAAALGVKPKAKPKPKYKKK